MVVVSSNGAAHGFGRAKRLLPQRRNRRWVAGAAFAVFSVATLALLGRKLTHADWPLANSSPVLVVLTTCCYFASFVFRARGWRRLFPSDRRPDQARCLASVGAAAASGAVLPFRLDYLVKIGTLRKLGGLRIGFDAIALSIVSLGMVDAVTMLPLSVSATATTTGSLRGPLLIVVMFGLGCGALLLGSTRLAAAPPLRRSRRLRALAARVSQHRTAAGRRNTLIAGLYLFGCWNARAVGSVLLLSALGMSFSPTSALCVLCLSAAAGVLPITSGGAIANVSAAAAILLALGAGRNIAINFSLASGMLLVTTATAAALAGVALSPAGRSFAGRRWRLWAR